MRQRKSYCEQHTGFTTSSKRTVAAGLKKSASKSLFLKLKLFHTVSLINFHGDMNTYYRSVKLSGPTATAPADIYTTTSFLLCFSCSYLGKTHTHTQKERKGWYQGQTCRHTVMHASSLPNSHVWIICICVCACYKKASTARR